MKTNNPGFLFEITSKPNIQEDMLNEIEGMPNISESETSSLHIYIAGDFSKVDPFNNARFRRVFDNAEVIVMLEPKPKEKEINSERITDDQLARMHEKFNTLILKNSALKQKSNPEELNQLVSNNDKEALASKIMLAIAGQFIGQMGGKAIDLDQSKHLQKKENSKSKQFFPEQIILDKALLSNKNIKYIFDQPQEKVVGSDDSVIDILDVVFGEDNLIAKMFEGQKSLQGMSDQGDWKAMQEFKQKQESEYGELLKKPNIKKLENIVYDSQNGRDPLWLQLATKNNEYFISNKKHLIVIPASIMLDLEKMRYCTSLLGDRTVEMHGPFKEPQGLFWKIEDSKGINKGYLLGSIHKTPDHLLDLNGKILSCFQKSQILAVEADITRGEVEAARKEKTKVRLRGLISSLSQEQQAQAAQSARQFLPGLGYKGSVPELKDEQAIVLAIMLIQISLSVKLGWSGIDMELIKQAKDRQLPIVDLEDFKLHLGGDSKIEELALKLLCSPLEIDIDNADQVGQALEQVGKVLTQQLKEGIVGLAEDWEKGNLEAFDHSKIDSCEYRQEMISRNLTMANSVVRLVKEGKTPFCVVGSGHMAGEMSMISFLTQFGFKVTRKLV